MNTRNYENNNLKTAASYYQAMLTRDFDQMAGYLHDQVRLIGPLAEIDGKESVVCAAKNLGAMLKEIHIRSRFARENQIMFAYDMVVPEPIGKFRAAVCMEFTHGLISKIELFYDARPFVIKREEIFGNDNQK